MFSEPVIGERFFGRDSILELLNKRAIALKDGYRQNIALTGQSLVGKSSIIYQFLYTIREEGFIPIYVEVVKEPFRSFSNKFIATMLHHALAGKGEAAGLDMAELLEGSREVFPKTFAAIRRVQSLIDRADMDEAYSNLLGLTSVLKEEAQKPCIVILDEFDNLECLGIKNPFLNFGKVIMVQKDTMYIVSSSRNDAIKKILSEKLSLLFGNFEIVKVSNFDPAAAASYIDMKLSGLEIDGALKKFLIAFTDGNPFYLDKVLNASKALAFEAMSSYIDEGVLAAAIFTLIYDSSGAIHQYLLNYILELLDTKSRDISISILAAIAAGQNKQNEISKTLKIKRGEAQKSLGRLAELGLVSKNGIFYNIEDSMLEFWLENVYQRKKDLLVDGIFSKRAIFTQEIKTYIDGVLCELSREIPSRIADLFNLFSNEPVQIDSKNIRLPHFTKVEAGVFTDSRAFIAASFRGKAWIAGPYERCVTENDIIAYVKNIKGLELKLANKIIIPLNGIDENGKLLAKELKISIWDISVINTLLKLYNKRRIIIL